MHLPFFLSVLHILLANDLRERGETSELSVLTFTSFLFNLIPFHDTAFTCDVLLFLIYLIVNIVWFWNGGEWELQEKIFWEKSQHVERNHHYNNEASSVESCDLG